MKTYFSPWMLSLAVLSSIFLLAGCDDNGGGHSYSEFDEDFGTSSFHDNSSSSSFETLPSEPAIEDTTSVSDVKQLPDCGSANEGESFMVESENALYFCTGGEWSKDAVELLGVTCADGKLSLGAVPDILVEDSTSFGYDTAAKAVVHRREGVSIAGLAEKGPFHYGTSVKVVELDSVSRLADSPRSHGTCITSTDGSYRMDSVNLVSPYVRLEASGYYRSELSGGLSAELVTLKAVTDLTERDSVNVNMFTHLEAPRTLKIIENTGNNQPIRYAKAQAFKDILYSFGFVIEGFNESSFSQQSYGNVAGATVGSEKYSDDVKLFGDGDFSAALLAISIMMQRHGSGMAMISYADSISERIRGNGNWDDWGSRASLADWLMSLDINGDFERIRSNVSSWGMGDAPNFEKYLRKFWTKEFQFPDCNASTADSVVHIGYSQSSYFGCNYQDTSKTKVRFTCDANLGRWRAATDIEKDTVGLGADTSKYDGCIRPGVINKDKSYVYEASTKTWRLATSDDIMDFTDVEEVYNGLSSDESVVFVLRHGERTSETGESGHLTDNGKSQSKSVGAKFKGAGSMYFGYSGYTRTKETCENIASGAGLGSANAEVLAGLDGDWYVKSGDPSIENLTSWAYKGTPADNFYDLDDRSKEFVSNYILDKRSELKKVNFYISHDMMVIPLTVYASQRKVDLRYFDVQGTRNWINYLAGVAVIFDSAGKVRYVPVRGLDSGTMKL